MLELGVASVLMILASRRVDQGSQLVCDILSFSLASSTASTLVFWRRVPAVSVRT